MSPGSLAISRTRNLLGDREGLGISRDVGIGRANHVSMIGQHPLHFDAARREICDLILAKHVVGMEDEMLGAQRCRREKEDQVNHEQYGVPRLAAALVPEVGFEPTQSAADRLRKDRTISLRLG